MKTQMPKKDRDELLKRLAALVPFAKGSVCVSHKPCGNPWKCKKCLSGEMHPSVQYSFRENGKLRTMHVQPRFLKQVQEAVANGREVERLLVEAGKKYIGFLRTQECADERRTSRPRRIRRRSGEVPAAEKARQTG